MKDKETPLALVRSISKMFDRVYENLDSCLKAKSEGKLDWPDYCELPIAAAYTYMISNGFADRDASMVAAEITACWMWRRNKVIYAIDGILADMLRDQAEEMSLTDKLPMELLLHLPYPCIYIKAPKDELDGFFAWIEYDLDRKSPELRIQWVISNFKNSFPSMLHLVLGTIGDCIADTAKTIAANTHQPMPLPDKPDLMTMTAIQMILYIISDNSDIIDEPHPVPAPQPNSKKPKTVIRDQAREIDVKNVGVRVGVAIKKYMSNPSPASAREVQDHKSGISKRPHMRRGHWHHYWYGKKDDRKIKLRWVSPIAVNSDKSNVTGEASEVVIFPVK